MTDAPTQGKGLPEPYHSTIAAIYAAYENREQERRGYLGPSSLGTECDRALW